MRNPVELRRHRPARAALVAEFVWPEALRRDAAAAGALQYSKQRQNSPSPRLGSDRIGLAVVLEGLHDVPQDGAVAAHLVVACCAREGPPGPWRRTVRARRCR